jgi:hypothetical protein
MKSEGRVPLVSNRHSTVYDRLGIRSLPYLSPICFSFRANGARDDFTPITSDDYHACSYDREGTMLRGACANYCSGFHRSVGCQDVSVTIPRLGAGTEHVVSASLLRLGGASCLRHEHRLAERSFAELPGLPTAICFSAC